MREKITTFTSLICIFLAVCLLSSCTSQRQITYLQGIPENSTEEVMKIVQDYDIRIQPDDLISIMVNSKDHELVQMLNLPAISFHLTNTGASGGMNRMLGYTVEKDGTIDFPQLGTIQVQGMTRAELTAHIKQEIINKGLVKDPIVTIQLLNLKISVLGEVVHPGTFSMTTDKVTLFDALSQAGDMTIYGRRDNVKVIRERNGERTVATLDLRGREILSSPYYYLQQGDKVYVEPNKIRAGQREINQNRTVGTFASIVSVLISLSVLLFK